MVAVAALVGAGAVAGWFGGAPPPGGGGPKPTLLGAGATFPYPLISKWSSEYYTLTGVQVNYQSIGSGGGIQQITAKTVDFGATDAPLNPSERAAAPNLLHIPETIGAVTFAYKLPGVSNGLNITGAVLADIFLGNIRRWNDANLTALNPSSNLPDHDIFPVHRSDGSGTTFVWTSYLSQASTEWATRVGSGKSVSWPSTDINGQTFGLGAQGNEGVAGVIGGNSYACGYIELAYAQGQHMTVARVKNPAGDFVLPTLNSTASAAQSLSTTLPAGEADWGNVSILSAPAADAYPVSSLTYLLVYRELNVYGSAMTADKARALVDFVWWAVHDGQSYSSALTYVPLPVGVRSVDERSLGLVTLNGQAVRT